MGAPKSAHRGRVSAFFAQILAPAGGARIAAETRPESAVFQAPLRARNFKQIWFGKLAKVMWKPPEILGAPKSAQRERVLLFFRPKRHAGRRRPNCGRNPLQICRFPGLIACPQFSADLAWKIGGNFGKIPRNIERPEIGAAGVGLAVFRRISPRPSSPCYASNYPEVARRRRENFQPWVAPGRGCPKVARRRRPNLSLFLLFFYPPNFKIKFLTLTPYSTPPLPNFYLEIKIKN